MTPTAISTDAKASPRGPAGAGSATASAGPDFDGVLTSLGSGAAAAEGGAGTQRPATAEQALVAPRVAGNGSILSILVDKATGASQTAAPSKDADRDDGSDASSRADSGQAVIPLGLMSMLIATATPSMTSVSAAAQGAETGRVAAPAAKEATNEPAAIRGVDSIAAGDPKAGAPSVPVTTEVAEAFSGTVPDLKSATNKPLTTKAGDPDAGEASTAVASEALPVVLPDTKSATARPVATKARDPIAAAGTEAGRTIQSVSVSTQIAPAAAHASQPEIPALTNAPAATNARGAPAERSIAPTAKAETTTQAIATSAMPTVARIADAISDLADAPAPAFASATASSTPLPVAPARTLVLQLAPADLGTVAVRLHLTGQTLDVQLSVSDPKTLGLVSRERDTLAARLDDRGYQLNTLVIQGTDPSTSSTAGSHDTSHNGTGAGADRDQSAEGGRRGASGQPNRGTGRQTSGDSARGDASVDARGGLYI